MNPADQPSAYDGNHDVNCPDPGADDADRIARQEREDEHTGDPFASDWWKRPASITGITHGDLVLMLATFTYARERMGEAEIAPGIAKRLDLLIEHTRHACNPTADAA